MYWPVHLDRRERGVGLGVVPAQLVRDAEAVDQDALAAPAAELEAMEELQPRRIERVGAVGVRPELEVGVGGIGLGEIGGEIPQARRRSSRADSRCAAPAPRCPQASPARPRPGRSRRSSTAASQRSRPASPAITASWATRGSCGRWSLASQWMRSAAGSLAAPRGARNCQRKASGKRLCSPVDQIDLERQRRRRQGAPRVPRMSSGTAAVSSWRCKRHRMERRRLVAVIAQPEPGIAAGRSPSAQVTAGRPQPISSAATRCMAVLCSDRAQAETPLPNFFSIRLWINSNTADSAQ